MSNATSRRSYRGSQHARRGGPAARHWLFASAGLSASLRAGTLHRGLVVHYDDMYDNNLPVIVAELDQWLAGDTGHSPHNDADESSDHRHSRPG